MPSLFDGTDETEDIAEILDRMEANCPRPFSNSRELWNLRRATHIGGRNISKEKMLEKAVAMLADNGHMPEWFNQCPAASGVGDSSRNKHSNVDLVRWQEAEKQATLMELKWNSDSPSLAVRQILRYGAAYLFCRKHRRELPVENRPVMAARHVSLQVAVRRYYADEHLQDCLSRARESLIGLDLGTGMPGPSMSIDVLAFPGPFDRLPFANGADVRRSCGERRLTETGREILDAFRGLHSVYPDRGGAGG